MRGNNGSTFRPSYLRVCWRGYILMHQATIQKLYHPCERNAIAKRITNESTDKKRARCTDDEGA
jgi:hypothetical protein